MPDLRGLFLRGHGGNSAALGEPQGDAIRNVTGRVFSLGMANGGTGPFWSMLTAILALEAEVIPSTPPCLIFLV